MSTRVTPVTSGQKLFTVVLLLESLGFVIFFVFLCIQLVSTAKAASVATIILLVFAALFCVFVCVSTVRSVRHPGRAHGALVTWHIIQVTLACGLFLGPFANVSIALLLLLPALFVLFFLSLSQKTDPSK